MNKRGQFEIQFNWIFVLAVGAIILLFFSVIMIKQKGASEQTTNIFVLRNLEAILAGAEVSTGTVNFVDVPKVEIGFECNRYSIGSASKRFEIMNVFVPSKIKSNKLITWTLDWNLPYRVTNFLYLTSPTIKYVLIGNNDLAFSVNKNIPKELNKELIGSIADVVNKDDGKVRFVYFNDGVSDGSNVPSEFSKMSDKDVTALKVNGNKDTGFVEFFKKKGEEFVSSGTSYYLKEPSLIGAIFTDDIKMYDCVMKNVFKKLNIVTRIYQKKTESLKNYYISQGDSCANYHKSTDINIILGASTEFSPANIENINSASKALKQQNKQAQLYSCALIY